MNNNLTSQNFPALTSQAAKALDEKLNALLKTDYSGDFYALFASYQRILADNQRRSEWSAINDKLHTLFMCGKAAPLDGPMIGIPVSIRDSDFFRNLAASFGHERSLAASLDILATAWNATFADTGLWMGKTFEPVTRDTLSQKCDNDPDVLAAYNEQRTRIGRNFFRAPANPSLFQALGLPTITHLWRLKDRPASTDESGFDGTLLQSNLDGEKYIPYSKTGGIYLADMATSVLTDMQGKPVYALNYRWPKLHPAFPMSCLIDEIVQVAEGIYLGQLIYATRHFSLGTFDLPFFPGVIEPGEPYAPHGPVKKTSPDNATEISHLPLSNPLPQAGDGTNASLRELNVTCPDYGYQNNGYFLMMDPACARQVYAAFPQLRPRAGEIGYRELGYDHEVKTPTQSDGGNGWRNDATLQQKFTTLITLPDAGDVSELLHQDESVLQMLQRISNNISAQSNPDDNLKQFEPLHRLFRAGVAPGVKNGLFQGAGIQGYNVRLDGQARRDGYGDPDVARGFDYYHGATLNLHCGFTDNFKPDPKATIAEALLLPGILSGLLTGIHPSVPNILNIVWHSIGKHIFPWAGKSFEKISPRTLSMLLDESADLALRYPGRVAELKSHPASAPHYAALKKDAVMTIPGRYAAHLEQPWDGGMRAEDREFWQQEADTRYVMGYNLQDKRILSVETLMTINDMNYRIPDAVLQQASESSGSPFARQGYAFLGAADQISILPMNEKRRVFQFNYRYPLIGGPAPIGFCLDELVEIADGLFLGQLIYSTALMLPFHSGIDPADYDYQLFGYFLLLDDAWERHRQAIGLDTLLKG
jgi:hypothetical protein